MKLSSPDPHDPGGVRLQKVLAAAGLGSRRHCEELIAEGRVAIDGKRVREQGIRVDPDTVVITVDGERIITRVDLVYLACHKPRGMISAMSDDPNAGDTRAGRRRAPRSPIWSPTGSNAASGSFTSGASTSTARVCCC